MSANTHRLGWIGLGRMGTPMAEKLLGAGHQVSLWNRTRSKAEPLAAKGARLVDRPSDLAGVDILFTMVSTGKDLEQVYFGENGVATRPGQGPQHIRRLLVDQRAGIGQAARASRRASALSSWRFRFQATASA